MNITQNLNKISDKNYNDTLNKILEDEQFNETQNHSTQQLSKMQEDVTKKINIDALHYERLNEVVTACVYNNFNA